MPPMFIFFKILTKTSFGFSRCSKNCAPDRDKILEGMLIGFTYVDSYISPSDYKNPVKYNSNMKTLMTSLKISKRIFFFFHKNILQTNTGLIFEDYLTERYISFAGTETDMYFSDTELMRILIESPTVVSLNNREYLKLQELIANLGGFFNGILILTKLIFGDYLKFLYYRYVDANKTYNNESSKNELQVKDNEIFNKIKISTNNLVKNNDTNLNRPKDKSSLNLIENSEIIRNRMSDIVKLDDKTNKNNRGNDPANKASSDNLDNLTLPLLFRALQNCIPICDNPQHIHCMDQKHLPYK